MLSDTPSSPSVGVINGNTPTSPTVRRPAHACRRCRSRHQKCDIDPHRDTCSNCERASVACSGRGDTELRIRFSKISYKKPRRRNPTNDEASTVSGRTERPYRSTIEDVAVPRGDLNISDLGDESPRSSLGTRDEQALLSRDDSLQVVGDSTPSHIESQCLWPLSEEEVHLVKYFFTILASWFDFCDPQGHFEAYVGSTISNDAAILYGVLAISARHRKLTMGVADHKSDYYERRCLEVLIPALNDTTKALQDTALASAIILRLLEEMTEPADGQPISSHAVSAPVLMQIKQGNIRSSGLSDAAMIVALRQEIFVANMTRRAVEPIADYCNVDGSLEPASDAMWTYRIIAHAARVTSFAYGIGSKDIVHWDQLWQYLEDWELRKPDSFRPMYHAFDEWPIENYEGVRIDGVARGRSKLPTICYAYDCPLAGQQYLQLCRVLLLAHNPRTPVLGLGRADYLRKQDDEIREAVRIICGICKSNREYVPARSTAGLAIAMCGEMFNDPEETAELLQIVSEAELHLGWPCLKVSYKLQTFWNLPDFNF